MKKFILTCLALIAFMLPSIAQVSHDFNPNDKEPVVNEKITKDQVPAAILKSVSTRFNINDPLTWSRFPYALKEYGWVYDVGASNVKLDRYEVQMKTKDGHQLEAVYSANGDLIESREMAENIPTPKNVMDAFLKSPYKDWKIVGNKEIIKYYHDHNNSSVEQHFRLTVEKDGARRSISFNDQATNY